MEGNHLPSEGRGWPAAVGGWEACGTLETGTIPSEVLHKAPVLRPIRCRSTLTPRSLWRCNDINHDGEAPPTFPTARGARKTGTLVARVVPLRLPPLFHSCSIYPQNSLHHDST